MKKLFLGIAALAALVSCSTDRSKILKVYNWADYIDEAQIAEFEQWYQEQTGKEVHVVYQTFDVNESMLTKIEKGHEDYDVVCPSDYIIERMLRSDLLLPIDRNFGDTPDYTQNVAPYIVEKFKQIEGSGKDANDYAVSYMWGTIGIIYNPKFVSDEDVKTWEVLRDPRFKDKIYMKEAFRDVYTTLLIALNKDAIDAGEKTIEELPFDTSDESIAMVEQFLNDCKPNIAGYEADFGKEYMTQEKGWMNLSWSGDAAWAIDEAKEMGVELRYAIPEEASIVWFDGWVIPKYAKNVDAARYFINFLCRPEMALRNMDEIGYVSAIGGSEILAAKQDSTQFAAEDATYFFGEEAKGVCIDPVQYPSDEIIARCGMLHDTGDRTAALQEMWSRVKGDSANALTYIIIAGAVIAIAAAAVVAKNRKKNRHKKGGRR